MTSVSERANGLKNKPNKINFMCPTTNKISALAIIFFISTYAWSQLPSIPHGPSTDAARLVNFYETPVNQYTGIPDIRIPLCNLESMVLSVPVQIAYHPNDLRVAGEAGPLGLGWTLQAGGIVTRTLHGLPDEKPGIGYLSMEGLIPTTSTGLNISAMNYSTKRLCAEGQLDLEPDVFNVAAPGLSCRLVFDKDANGSTIVAIPVPFSNLIVSEKYGPGGIESWIITNTKGITYHFGRLPNGREAIERTAFAGNEMGGLIYSSAWYLLKMVSPGQTDSVEFYYDLPSIATYKPYSSCMSFGLNGCQNGLAEDLPISNTLGKHLTKIVWPSGSLRFRYLTPRQDIPSTGSMLDSVILYSISGAKVLSYAFYHSYFQSWGCSSTEPYKCLRLRLDSLQQVDSLGNVIPSYRFLYNSADLPPKDSKAIDHWGFYNGALQNSTLIPSIQAGPILFNGADRNPNPSVLVNSVLTGIVNPFGGVESYQWEAHDYRFSASTPVSALVLLPQTLTKSVQGPAFGALGDTVHFPFLVTHGQDIDLIHQCSHLQGFTVESYAEIVDAQGNVLKTIDAGTLDWPFFVTAGEMRLRMISFPNESFQVSLSWTNYQIQEDSSFTTTDLTAGGLRIASITNDNGITEPLVRAYEYDMENGTSSGVLLHGSPVYQYITFSPIIIYNGPPGNSLPIVNGGCTYLNVLSSDNIQYGSFSEGAVVYRRVKEIWGASGEFGSVISRFSFVPEERNAFLPFPPSASRSFQRGYLIDRMTFNKDDILRTKEHFKYSYIPSMVNGQPKYIEGLKIGWLEKSIGPAYDRFAGALYSYDCGYMQLDTIVEVQHDLQGSPMSGETQYLSYRPSGHLKPYRINTSYFDGSNEQEHFIYTEDLLSPPSVTIVSTNLIVSRDALARTSMQLFDAECISTSGILDSERLVELDQAIDLQSESFTFLLDSLQSRKGPPQPPPPSQGQSSLAAWDLIYNNILGLVWLDEVQVSDASGCRVKSSIVNDYKVVSPGVVRLSRQLRLAEHSQCSGFEGLMLNSSGYIQPLHPHLEQFNLSDYDDKGRLKSVLEPDGRVSRIAYSGFTNLPCLMVSGKDLNYAAIDFNGMAEGIVAPGNNSALPECIGDSAYSCQQSPFLVQGQSAGDYRLIFRYKVMQSSPTVNIGSIQYTLQTLGIDRHDWNWCEASFVLAANGTVSISGDCLIDDILLIPRDNRFDYRKYSHDGLVTLEMSDSDVWMEYEYDGFGRAVRSNDFRNRTRATWEHKIAGK